MATKAELQKALSDGQAKLEDAVKAFEALRAKGSASDLVKAGATLTSLERALSKADYELVTFALVGVYEAIKAQVLEAAKRWDIKALLEHDISNVRIDVPLNAQTGVESDRVIVNTLGKRTVIKGVGGGGGGNGRGRAKYQMRNDASGETLTPRDFLEAHGEEALGDVAGKVLAEPQRYGLVDYAERAGRKLGWSKVEIEA